jgi:multidrug resistance efflux pump
MSLANQDLTRFRTMFPMVPRAHRVRRPYGYDRSASLYHQWPHLRPYGSPYMQTSANNIEEATRAHVKAAQEYEEAKKDYEKVKKTYEEKRFKVEEAEKSLKNAKQLAAYC